MLRGMATVVLTATDVLAAVAWYTEVLGIEPYFARDVDGAPAYVEFRIGDYQHELGIMDARYAVDDRDKPGGVTLYWHVDDVQAAFDRLIGLGAKQHRPPTDRGAGFVPASVVDPFGNILGVMYNPHYLEILG
nr:VOC family protein [Kibdelosporangium sp. MJ126-NF4]CEL14386.1 possible dioxygenase [Kibdelosporangium sp. MJ126-NF4]CTQ88751.1 possible dioxygenase [Kibdelosporangium sp. MJ126-NF4]